MSSINTNAAAMTALQTLKATNKNLDVTQNRISTGFRVSEASHNAAYWSIATTMRSDNKALSTVQDALGLGSAQVDVAYTALDTAKDLVDEMKKKVIAASQPGVDKAKVQSEISQIQSSLKSLAESASFSGTNWLAVDSSAPNFKVSEKIVAAFTRGEGGQISLGTVDIEVGKIALFDKGGAGLLERAEGIDNAGILAETGTTGVTTVGGALTRATQTIGATLDTTGGLTFDVVIGGQTQSVNLGALNGAATTVADIAAAINTQINNGSLTGVSIAVVGTDIQWTVEGQGPEHTLSIANAQINSVAAGTQNATGANANVNATATFNGTFEAMTLDADDSISFTLDLDGAKHDIKIDKATVDAALGVTTGAIATQANFVTVLNKAFANANLSNTLATVVGGKVTLTSTTTGADSKVEVSALRHSSGSAAFDVVEMDISNATAEQLAAYAQGLDDVFNAVVTAASDLGAIKTRIDNQKDFVSKLTDALSRGIGQLVDADMEEESTRLQALQVQQQLGIQALSIANGNSQNILSLFRS